jgi:glycosyltransferase involved in cell wall biosynthesis
MNSSINSPVFSLVVPTYNRLELLKICVQSILDQHFRDFELIVVDDESTDGTKAYLNQLNDPHLVTNFLKKGERSTARNTGLDLAKGKYICFIDDDDYLLPNYLDDFYCEYEKEGFPNKIIRTGYLKEIGSSRIKTQNYNARKHKHPVNFSAYHMCGIWTLSIPSDFLKIDRFPPQFPHWQDTHLILRLLAKCEFTQLENYNYVYRIHDKMGSQHVFGDQLENKAKLNTDAIRHLFENYYKEVNGFLPEKTKEFLLAEKYLQYACGAKKKGDKKLASQLLSKANSNGIFIKNLRYYFRYFLNLF